MDQSSTVPIAYFSDILCIWAYAAEARIEEAKRQFGRKIAFDYRYCQVFGDTAQRIGVGWANRGGYEGFNAHLKEVTAGFEHLEVHPDIWLSARPASSASTHLFLKAVELCTPDSDQRNPTILEAATWRARLAFFRECRDISQRDVLYEIAEELSLPIAPIESEINSGRAMAALCSDLDAKERLKIEGSPTFVLNEGRQKLYGNIGYRVIEANIQELLRAPDRTMASWC